MGKGLCSFGIHLGDRFPDLLRPVILGLLLKRERIRAQINLSEDESAFERDKQEQEDAMPNPATY